MKKKVAISLLVVIILGFGYFKFSYNSDTSFAQKEKKVKPVTEVVELKGTTVADFTDKKQLVGLADNVFTGTVVTKVDQIDLHLPTTIFEVSIDKSLKGKFDSDTVKVSQYGGYQEDEDGNKILTIVEDDELLKQGDTYIFSTIRQEDGRNHIIAAYDNVKVKNKDEKIKLEKEFENAHKNEIISKFK